MSVSRLHRSIDLVLEGIDNCDIDLILEASQAFTKGHRDLIEQIKEFIKVLENAQHGGQLEEMLKSNQKFLKQLQEIDLEKIPDKFSFKANSELHGTSENENPGVATCTQIAAAFDTYYNGTKDAIIEIAKLLEGFKDVFAVGRNGIVLTQAFAKVDNIEDNLSVMAFTYTPPEEMASFLATGQDGGVNEEWKKVFSQELTQIAEKLGNPEEKVEEAEQAFLDQIEQIGNAVKPLADKIAKGLHSRQPDEEIQDAVESEGFLQSLFKLFNPTKIETKQAQAITEALLRLPITNLWKLTQGLIAMTANAEKAIETAVKGTQEQTKNITEVPPEAAKFKSRLNDFIKTDKRKADILATHFELLGEKHGIKAGESWDYTKIPIDKVKEMLTDHEFDDNKIKEFLKEFGFTEDQEEEEPDELSPEAQELVDSIESLEDKLEDSPENADQIRDQQTAAEDEILELDFDTEIQPQIDKAKEALKDPKLDWRSYAWPVLQDKWKEKPWSDNLWKKLTPEEFEERIRALDNSRHSLNVVLAQGEQVDVKNKSSVENWNKQLESKLSVYIRNAEKLKQQWDDSDFSKENNQETDQETTENLIRRWAKLAGIIKG
tara:strand:- start:14831 stop:16645 length:1815 start_codon:yes stop_codon:yes gene_type:complete